MSQLSIIQRKSWNGDPSCCEGWRDITIGEMLREQAALRPDKTAIVEHSGGVRQAYTYAELDCLADLAAAYYLERGLKTGDKVIFQIENGNAFVIALFGLLRLGIFPVMAVPALGYTEISKIAEQIHPAAYVTSQHAQKTEDGFYVNREEYVFCSIPHLIRTTDLIEAIGKNTGIAEKPSVKPDPRGIALFLLSGGTTGVPKLIPRTHADYLYNSRMSVNRMKMDENSVNLAMIPMAHNFTLATPGLLGSLLSGGTFVSCANAGPAEMFYLTETEHVTLTALVPTMLELICDFREIDTFSDLSSLKYIMSGGGMLLPETAKRVLRTLDCRLVQVFGTAEGLNCTTDPDAPPESIVDHQGRAISDYDIIKIVRPDDSTAELGEEGELLTKGPYTIHAYFERPDLQDSRFTADGFYRAGDKAQITPEGNLRILGRVREQINRCGEKIMPSEVESELMKHPAMIRCAVVGVPDPLLGNSICALIEAEPAVTAQDIKKLFKENGVSSLLYPDHVFPMHQWPVTTVKKLDRDKLVKYAQQLLKQDTPMPLHEIPMSYLIARNEQGNLNGVSCHAYVEFSVDALDEAILKDAWRNLFAVHPYMQVQIQNDGTAIRWNDQDAETVLTVDLSSLPDADAEREIRNYRGQISHRKLRIDKGQSMSLLLFRLRDTHVLIFDVDLTVCDVPSFHILLNDLGRCYTALKNGTAMPAADADASMLGMHSDTPKDWQDDITDYPPQAVLPEQSDAAACSNARYHAQENDLDAESWRKICRSLDARGYDTFAFLNTCFACCMIAHGNHHNYYKTPVFPRPEGESGCVFDYTRLLFIRFAGEQPPQDAASFAALYDQISGQISAQKENLPASVLALMRRFPQPDQFRGDIVFSMTPETDLLAERFGDSMPQLRFLTSQTPGVALDMQIYGYHGGLYLNTVVPESLIDPALTAQLHDEFLETVKKYGGIQ